MNLLITGGSGFIGSNFVELALGRIKTSPHINKVVNLDALTYAGDISNTQNFAEHPKYYFEKVNIQNYDDVCGVFERHKITHVVHLAAESHVDNSISGPDIFIDTNIVGTFNLLKAAQKYNIVRFHHVSTDEVYGELGATGEFSENSPYSPNNPYSASKASSDFLVKSYYHTYKTPVTISNCSNNFGPKQHREKFIPTIIKSIANNQKIPVYGEGLNVRDWIYVKDHCEGIWAVLESGRLGETYCIGANCEKTNIEVVNSICEIIGVNPEDWIEYVPDRQGHDYRYAINSNKIREELGWSASHGYESAMEETVRWYYERG